MQFSDLFAVDSRHVIAFSAVALVVVVVAFIARRTQGDPGLRAVRPSDGRNGHEQAEAGAVPSSRDRR